MKPLCIDLFCGLGGWTEGFLAEGYTVFGFDIERHVYGEKRYPAQLVIQDVLTLHGSQFRNAACIVASPPCQAYSYMAMPWKLAKAKAAAIRADETGAMRADLTRLFDACFRIQREACEWAGRHIPMVVENVKGAQPWVGRAQANYGSFYLWGDVASVGGRIVPVGAGFGAAGVKALTRGQKRNPDGTEHPQGSWFKIADSKNRGARRKGSGGSWFAIEHGQRTSDALYGNNPVRGEGIDGRKVPGMNFHEHEKTGKPGRSFQSAAVEGIKRPGMNWSGSDKPGYKAEAFNSSGPARKAASAEIAKIPLALSSHIARCFKPGKERAA